MDAVERAKVIDWLTREHRNEVYEALLRRAEERGSTIHEDIIAAWKANHLEEVRPIARGGLRPSLVPLYRIKGTSTPSTVCEHGNYGPSCDQCQSLRRGSQEWCSLCGEPVVMQNGQLVHDKTPPTPHRAVLDRGQADHE